MWYFCCTHNHWFLRAFIHYIHFCLFANVNISLQGCWFSTTTFFCWVFFFFFFFLIQHTTALTIGFAVLDGVLSNLTLQIVNNVLEGKQWSSQLGGAVAASNWSSGWSGRVTVFSCIWKYHLSKLQCRHWVR
jgi:hypothetical protein